MNDYTTIKVIFNSNSEISDEDVSDDKKYTYKCLKSVAAKLTVLDRVIITDPYGILKIVAVMEIHEESIIKKDSKIKYKFISGTTCFV